MNVSYIAGFFDGEGSVTIKVAKDERKKYAFYLGGRVTFTQNDKSILEDIQRFIGYGHISKKTEKCHVLEIQNETLCRNFIDLVKGDLVLKRKQLILLKEFFDTRIKYRNWSYSKEEMLILIGFAERMQILNSGKITSYLQKAKEEILTFDEEKYNVKIELLNDQKRDWLNHLRLSKKKIPKKELLELYTVKKLSCPQIAKIYNVHYTTIRRRLKEYEIPRRQPPEDLLNFRKVR